ncbi:MAG: aldo/keto reductase [Treponema sp.]|jgi:predicted aldo/keto reductase-like oxidoreductase|nr:aldo/keto reductase [Treponema sp.]
MQYRPIGKTGMSASVIGLGAEHLDGKPYETAEMVINAALEQGFNIMDVFMPGKVVRENIGRVLNGRRDKMLIQGHICSTDIREQYDRSRDLPTVKKYFEDLLRYLKTDYIDFGMLFYIDTENDFSDVFETEILRYAQDLKQQGRIRAIGASSHNPVIAKKVVETGIIDLLMFSINPAFDMASAGTSVLDYLDKDKAMDFEKKLDHDRAALYQLCEQRDVAITTMKTLGAGKLLSPEHTPFAQPLTVAQCIHYALTRPAVVSALIGCATPEQVQEAAAYLDKSDAERDYSAIIRDYQGDFKGRCVYCNHCLPCPSEINIANVHKYLDIAVLDEANISPSIVGHYRALDHRASDCIACRSCEERCPFSVPIVRNMQKAAALLG